MTNLNTIGCQIESAHIAHGCSPSAPLGQKQQKPRPICPSLRALGHLFYWLQLAVLWTQLFFGARARGDLSQIVIFIHVVIYTHRLCDLLLHPVYHFHLTYNPKIPSQAMRNYFAQCTCLMPSRLRMLHHGLHVGTARVPKLDLFYKMFFTGLTISISFSHVGTATSERGTLYFR